MVERKMRRGVMPEAREEEEEEEEELLRPASWKRRGAY